MLLTKGTLTGKVRNSRYKEFVLIYEVRPHRHIDGENYINNVLHLELNTLMHRYEAKMDNPHTRKGEILNYFSKTCDRF